MNFIVKRLARHKMGKPGFYQEVGFFHFIINEVKNQRFCSHSQAVRMISLMLRLACQPRHSVARLLLA